MDRTALRTAYNARIMEMGAEEKLACLGVVKQDGDAAVLNTRTVGVNLLHFAKDAAWGVIVSGWMDAASATAALKAYAACIDLMMGVTEKKRNEYLGRLHMFDGKLRPQGSNLTVRGHLMEIRPAHPAKGMISFTVANLTGPMPAELLMPENRTNDPGI